MTTSCAIIKKNADGSFSESSIRADGYLTGVGMMLFKHYQDSGKIDRLMALGWVTSLEAEIDDHYPGETFDGEYPALWPAEKREECINTSSAQGFVYLWEDGKWFHGVPKGKYLKKLNKYKDGVQFTEITRDYLVKNADVLTPVEIVAYLDSTEKPVPTKTYLTQMHDDAVERDKHDPRVFHFNNGVVCGDFEPTHPNRRGVMGFNNDLGQTTLKDSDREWVLKPAAAADISALYSQANGLAPGDTIDVDVFQEIRNAFGQHSVLTITSIKKVVEA